MNKYLIGGEISLQALLSRYLLSQSLITVGNVCWPSLNIGVEFVPDNPSDFVEIMLLDDTIIW